MDGHVQRNEGMNSTIKHIAAKCPNIGLPLLSARVGTASALGVNGRMHSRKWSNIRAPAAKLSAECVEHFGQAGEIMQETDRWSSPAIPPTSCQALRP